MSFKQVEREIKSLQGKSIFSFCQSRTILIVCQLLCTKKKLRINCKINYIMREIVNYIKFEQLILSNIEPESVMKLNLDLNFQWNGLY